MSPPPTLWEPSGCLSQSCQSCPTPAPSTPLLTVQSPACPHPSSAPHGPSMQTPCQPLEGDSGAQQDMLLRSLWASPLTTASGALCISCTGKAVPPTNAFAMALLGLVSRDPSQPSGKPTAFPVVGHTPLFPCTWWHAQIPPYLPLPPTADPALSRERPQLRTEGGA